MKGLFSYDSPVMQILMYIGDLIILNFIYLLCCVPVFTIGAAQAGMYTAMRVLNDKEDDSSVSAAFFRGFANGFGKVTLAWGLLTLVLVLVGAAAMLGYVFGLPMWLCIVSFALAALFHSLVPAFHSRFGCTAMQLIRNAWFLAVAHPLRCLGVALMLWLPVILFLTNTNIFMTATPIWGTLYFSTAFLFAELLLRKPFQTLVDDFNEKHAPQLEEANEEKPEKIFSDTPVD